MINLVICIFHATLSQKRLSFTKKKKKSTLNNFLVFHINRTKIRFYSHRTINFQVHTKKKKLFERNPLQQPYISVAIKTYPSSISEWGLKPVGRKNINQLYDVIHRNTSIIFVYIF